MIDWEYVGVRIDSACCMRCVVWWDELWTVVHVYVHPLCNIDNTCCLSFDAMLK